MEATDPESFSWLRFAFASATVIALMAALAWGLKALALRGLLRPSRPDERIRILSSVGLDARRRLVLVKCDQTEHLILLGPSGDVVVSSFPSLSSPPSSPPPSSEPAA